MAVGGGDPGTVDVFVDHCADVVVAGVRRIEVLLQVVREAQVSVGEVSQAAVEVHAFLGEFAQVDVPAAVASG